MKAMRCTVCGATINPVRMMCEYCDTHYVRDSNDDIIRVETYHNPVKGYKPCLKRLSKNLAEDIAENMDVTGLITMRL